MAADGGRVRRGSPPRRLVLCARADGTGFLTPETSRAKAVAAAAFRKSTTELAEAAAKGSAVWRTMPAVLQEPVLPTPGGSPIVRGGKVIGGVGCRAGRASRTSTVPTPAPRRAAAVD